MKQDEIAVMFRRTELARRLARQQKLLEAEAQLANEPLTEEEQVIHGEAVRQVKAYQQHLEKELSPGYWRRLWAALLNR